MANPLRNAMVYLGLAEEQEETTAPTASSRPAPAPAPVQTDRVEAVQEEEFSAPVTPIKPTVTPAPAPKPSTTAVGEMNEILTVHPKAYDKDAQLIAESFRDGVPVIMNLSQMTDADARRIIDFASGLTQGLNGRIERVTNRVFLLTPEHVNVHGDEQHVRNDDPTFFA
ncbi:cell division protein SepF [Gulosibacter sp. ACHW.36C]|uniref:Cell division protein SepF n=1 Tax=Gulosibacter sediminis TaxID=1729695 RepID=A0ABY4MWW5_9MICO|nr:cell division protein SepF [Gulosibacter sediminis]UQN13886.1 cell division protein SepF [Gulosibacter sediminis]